MNSAIRRYTQYFSSVKLAVKVLYEAVHCYNRISQTSLFGNSGLNNVANIVDIDDMRTKATQ